jgi:hypothetical protein
MAESPTISFESLSFFLHLTFQLTKDQRAVLIHGHVIVGSDSAVEQQLLQSRQLR